MTTILQKIQKNENDCLGNLSLLSEYLLKLSASIIDCENAKTISEIEYTKKWVETRKGVESDKSCDMQMKLEPEFIDLRAKEAMSKTLIETIRSVKKRLAFLSLEYNENI